MAAVHTVIKTMPRVFTDYMFYLLGCKIGRFHAPVVGVVRLELTASSSQNWRATNCAIPRQKKEKSNIIFFTTGRLSLRTFPLQHNYYIIIFILGQIFKRYKFIFFQILYKFHNIKWFYFLPFFNPRFNARNSYFRKEGK